jgi:hypothetical protein
MGVRRARREGRPDPLHDPSARKVFARFRPEEEKNERSLLKRRSALERLVDAYIKTRELYRLFGIGETLTELTVPATGISLCYPSLYGIKYGKKDIEGFPIALKKEWESDFDLPGFFTSAAIRFSRFREFDIKLDHLDNSLLHFIPENEEIVIIHGDLDCVAEQMKDGLVIVHGNTGREGAGDDMRGGALIIKGNAGNAAAGMLGGLMIIEGSAKFIGGYAQNSRIHNSLILVKGNCEGIGSQLESSIVVMGNTGDGLGYEMESGYIKVAGNAGKDVGDKMKGGEIHVDGEIGSIGDVAHGKIYHKGKLIVDK